MNIIYYIHDMTFGYIYFISFSYYAQRTTIIIPPFSCCWLAIIVRRHWATGNMGSNWIYRMVPDNCIILERYRYYLSYSISFFHFFQIIYLYSYSYFINRKRDQERKKLTFEWCNEEITIDTVCIRQIWELYGIPLSVMDLGKTKRMKIQCCGIISNVSILRCFFFPLSANSMCHFLYVRM